ncbi:hypothetical protein CAC42_2732 [Sphaceloma murrayae]|uniref:BTB domain-containing protein n=1 Tax=Sphaceloma murrayae TaxID=2082308 RepID=A0A2K1R0H6_9PEZI|nr:hypothetical protein CAC42_2732 [Sphaceloma murrayae]
MDDSFTKRLYGDTKFTDLVMVCQDRHFKVHKIIVCDVSPWLEEAVNNAAKDQDSRIVVVRACDPFTLHRVIEYSYLKDYQDDDLAITLPPTHQSSIDPRTPRSSNVWDMLELSGHSLSPTDIKTEPSPTNFAARANGDTLVGPQEASDIGNIYSTTGTDIIILDRMFSDRAKDPKVNRAWIHLKVYHAAIKFDISPLADVSISRLESQISGAWALQGFVDLVQVTFALSRQQLQATPACNLLADECAKHIEVLLSIKAFDDEVRENSHLGYLIIHALVAAITQQKASSSLKPTPKLSMSLESSPRVGKLSTSADQSTMIDSSPVFSDPPFNTNTVRASSTPTPTTTKALFTTSSTSAAFNFDMPDGFGKLQEHSTSGISGAQQQNITTLRSDSRQAFDGADSAKQSAAEIDRTTDCETLKNRIMVLQSDLAEAKAQRDACERREQELQAAGTVADQEIFSLKGELADSEQIIAELRGQAHPGKDHNAPGKTTGWQLMADKEKLFEENVKLAHEKRSLQDHNHALLRGNKNLIEQLQAAHAAVPQRARSGNVAALERDISRKISQIQALQSSNLAHKANSANYKKQIAELREVESKTRDLEAAVMTHKEHAQKLEKHITNLTAKHQEEVAALKNVPPQDLDLFNFEGQARDLAALNEKKTNEIRGLHSQIRSLQMSLSQAEQAIKIQDSKPASTFQPDAAHSENASSGRSLVEEGTRSDKNVTTNGNAGGEVNSGFEETLPGLPHQAVPERARRPSTDSTSHPQGPMTFAQKMMLRSQTAQNAIPVPAPSATAPSTSANNENLRPQTSASPRMPVVPLGGPTEREREIEKGRRIAQEMIAEKAVLLKKSEERVKFLEARLSELRMTNAGVPTGPRAGLGHSAHAGGAGENRVRKFYNEALKVAGQDFKACSGCGAAFYAQFRGAPEDGGNTLILRCTKCDEEVFRWKM